MIRMLAKDSKCRACDEPADSYAWTSIIIYPYDPYWVAEMNDPRGYSPMIYCHKCLAKVNRK